MSSPIEIPTAARDALHNFLTITPIAVQWGDQDAMGHVNNVVYFRWFESARIDFLDRLQSQVQMDKAGIGPILASIDCNYRRQLHFPDILHVGSRISKIGRSSIGIAHAIYSERLQAIAADGASVIVVFDYAANRSVRIPDALRQTLEAAMQSGQLATDGGFNIK